MQTAWFIPIIERKGWCHLLRTLLAAATRSYVLASSYMILTRNWPSISSWASLLKTKWSHHSWATERCNTKSRVPSWAAVFFSADRNNSVTTVGSYLCSQCKLSWFILQSHSVREKFPSCSFKTALCRNPAQDLSSSSSSWKKKVTHSMCSSLC